MAHRPGRQQNGFYFLAILDALPRPHNNTWIHHHRKVVMDTDSNVPPWIEIWDGQRFVIDGRRPVNMLAVDGGGPVSTLAGKPFLPFAGGTWQSSGTVRAVDAFLPDTWYRVTVERFDAPVHARDLRPLPLRRRGHLRRHHRRRAALRVALQPLGLRGRHELRGRDALRPASAGVPAVAAGATWPDWTRTRTSTWATSSTTT